MVKLIVFSGIPASGKTTISERLAKENNYIRISMDEGNYVKHDDMIDDIVGHLKDGRSVVADSLYDSAQHRVNLLDRVQSIECECICIVMNTPLEECIRRNNTRKNPLPSGLIQCISEHYETPSLDEGWNNIVNIDMKQMLPNCTNMNTARLVNIFMGRNVVNIKKKTILEEGENNEEKY